MEKQSWDMGQECLRLIVTTAHGAASSSQATASSNTEKEEEVQEPIKYIKAV